ncbi:hypothetical protein BQ9231_00239 [Cedratvirus lausannensis]|uniref:Uncharacterized protein n=1 Tax=Cedratvirus lausannensis TaxID=2023205 RepID=A0A285PY51_9VIRU|nr:hypothetical protein BQ9231_00239 [Cedratvirus lausannensis]
MEGDKEIPLLENVLLYVHCQGKKKFWKDFTITINDREIRDVPIKNGLSMDTGLRKGDLIWDVVVCTGCLRIQGYAFRIRECVEELHLEIKGKKVTLNGRGPVLTDIEACLLM